jgi:cell division protein ZapA
LNAPATVAVSILDREYKMACANDTEKQAVMQAAAYLDRKMRDLRQANKTLTVERIAVLAALNMTHEAFDAKNQLSNVSSSVDIELRRLNAKLDGVLDGSHGNQPAKLL